MLKPERKKRQGSYYEFGTQMTQIRQIGADLKRLRNLYSSDEQVHRMRKKRNKITLVTVMNYELKKINAKVKRA